MCSRSSSSSTSFSIDVRYIYKKPLFKFSLELLTQTKLGFVSLSDCPRHERVESLHSPHFLFHPLALLLHYWINKRLYCYLVRALLYLFALYFHAGSCYRVEPTLWPVLLLLTALLRLPQGCPHLPLVYFFGVDFWFAQSKSLVLVFFDHLVNVVGWLGRGVARLVLIIPGIDYPFFGVALGSEGEEGEGGLEFVDVAEKLEFLFGALCGLVGIRFFYFHYIFSECTNKTFSILHQLIPICTLHPFIWHSSFIIPLNHMSKLSNHCLLPIESLKVERITL